MPIWVNGLVAGCLKFPPRYKQQSPCCELMFAGPQGLQGRRLTPFLNVGWKWRVMRTFDAERQRAPHELIHVPLLFRANFPDLSYILSCALDQDLDILPPEKPQDVEEVPRAVSQNQEEAEEYLAEEARLQANGFADLEKAMEVASTTDEIAPETPRSMPLYVMIVVGTGILACLKLGSKLLAGEQDVSKLN
eukprot:scaffold647965_cov49-Prasinocladus_malaysianus.AAC.1